MTAPPETPVDLAAENARLKRELAEARGEVERYRPFVEVPILDSIEKYKEAIGPERLRESAVQLLAVEARQRRDKGLPPLWEDSDFEARVAAHIEKGCVEAVSRLTASLSDDPGRITRMRSLKMVHPNGTMWQLPLSGTINNAAGSLNDPIEIYKRKGDKMATPIRCLLWECWLARAEDRGRPTFGGYCSAYHQQVMEGTARIRSDGSMVDRSLEALR